MVPRIAKMIATGGFRTALECTKFVFGRVSALDPTGERIQHSPRPLAGLKGPTSKGEECEGEGKGKKKGRGRKGGGPSLSQIPGSAPGNCNPKWKFANGK